MMTRFLRLAAALTAALWLSGVAHAKPARFSTVPANIADAPVKEWRSVERRDKGSAFRWKIRFPSGTIWIAELAGGVYWPAWKYESESNVLSIFKKSKFEKIRRVESTASHGSQWGYMALAEKNYRDCVVGVVLDDDNHVHDGGQGGTLRGYVIDCGSGAVGRFDAWRTWFRSFKRVPLGYNAALD